MRILAGGGEGVDVRGAGASACGETVPGDRLTDPGEVVALRAREARGKPDRCGAVHWHGVLERDVRLELTVHVDSHLGRAARE